MTPDLILIGVANFLVLATQRRLSSFFFENMLLQSICRRYAPCQWPPASQKLSSALRIFSRVPKLSLDFLHGLMFQECEIGFFIKYSFFIKMHDWTWWRLWQEGQSLLPNCLHLWSCWQSCKILRKSQKYPCKKIQTFCVAWVFVMFSILDGEISWKVSS